MTAGKAIYYILSGDSGLSSLVGDRVFPEIAAQDAATPYVVYQLSSVEPQDTKGGPSTLDEVRFEVFCVSNEYTEAQDVTEAVRAALDRARGTFQGVPVQSVQYLDEDAEFEATTHEYFTETRYLMRLQRSGTVPNTGGDMITIQEIDGTPSGDVTTLKVPNGFLAVTGSTATLSYPAAPVLEAAKAVATLGIIGSSPTNYNGQTGIIAPLGSVTDQTHANTAQISSNGLRISWTGWVRVTAIVTAQTENHHGAVRITLTDPGRSKTFAEGVAYISGQHGVNEGTVTLETIENTTAAGDTFCLTVTDLDNTNNAVYVKAAAVTVFGLE